MQRRHRQWSGIRCSRSLVITSVDGDVNISRDFNEIVANDDDELIAMAMMLFSSVLNCTRWSRATL